MSSKNTLKLHTVDVSDVFAKLHFTDKLRDSFSGPGSHADWEEKVE